MRNALARTLYELARKDERIVVIVADISPAGAMEDFRREFPDRFVNVGVAEQSMIGLAAGLAQRGYKPFCYTIATFALFRAYEFVRCDLAYQDLPVTIVGMGAGLSYSTLGGTHQAIEDVAVAMACPNLTVLAPCDPAETAECARWCAGRESGGPVYMRIGKAGEPDLTENAPRLEIGRVRWLRPSGGDICVVSYGPIMVEALRVADQIGASVANVVQLSGVDITDISCILAHKRVVVIEEASNSPLAYLIKSMDKGNCLDIADTFCLWSDFIHIHGTRDELLAYAGLTAEKILAQL